MYGQFFIWLSIFFNLSCVLLKKKDYFEYFVWTKIQWMSLFCSAKESLSNRFGRFVNGENWDLQWMRESAQVEENCSSRYSKHNQRSFIHFQYTSTQTITPDAQLLLKSRTCTSSMYKLIKGNKKRHIRVCKSLK